jgi:hypothetical protein
MLSPVASSAIAQNKTMIEQLTSQQKALIPVYREKWRKIALSTEPIDREKAAQSVKFAYAALGYKEPQIIICDSPRAAFDRILLPICPTNQHSPSWRQIKQQITATFGRDIAYQMLTQLTQNPSEIFLFCIPQTSVEKLLKYQLLQYFYSLMASAFGSLERSIDYRNRQFTVSYKSHKRWHEFDRFATHQHNDINKYFFAAIYRGALSDFYISVLNGDRDPVKWRAFKLLVANCGWIYPFEKVCIVCDRPRILSFDSQHRLHAQAGPAIQFADGYSLYSYHGFTLPEKYGKVHPNEWRSEWILSEENINLKKFLIQSIGDR